MNQIDPHAHLRAAFGAGCRIQAWHLNTGAANSNDGRWDTLTPPEDREPEFGCETHLYRVHPEDEAKALEVWDFRMPTGHLPPKYRFYVERLVSNTNPAGMVRDNELLREEVQRLAALVEEAETVHPVQNDGMEVRWPKEAKPSADGDGYVALTLTTERRMDETQARVWNACRAACISAHRFAVTGAP
ncbi:hypothetical protein ACHZ97_14490 [Lysobacter soli]|uniref:hypothetical protein n=1 Tax=Lysobacter soli TaxID=453783 RepID=UPI0037C8EC62